MLVYVQQMRLQVEQDLQKSGGKKAAGPNGEKKYFVYDVRCAVGGFLLSLSSAVGSLALTVVLSLVPWSSRVLPCESSSCCHDSDSSSMRPS